MTERERWIVYPLLFLALGASLRDKLFKQTFSERVSASQIRCEQLLCENIICGALESKQVVKTPTLRADNVAAGGVSAQALRQNGQPVLSISPQYLPQFLQRLGLWHGPAPANQPVPAPAAPEPNQQSPSDADNPASPPAQATP